ncbi:MAG: hypothetical protein HQK78_16340 [Desulfobacterales bacterium]|nr:hypothetical protein [Desulfobacterales bacterium]
MELEFAGKNNNIELCNNLKSKFEEEVGKLLDVLSKHLSKGRFYNE